MDYVEHTRCAGISAVVVLVRAPRPAGAGGRRVTKATITVGRAANGAALDMTRRQVVARLGRQVGRNGPDVLSCMPGRRDLRRLSLSARRPRPDVYLLRRPCVASAALAAARRRPDLH